MLAAGANFGESEPPEPNLPFFLLFDGSEVVELHGERGTALTHGPQIGSVAEHLRKWNDRVDFLHNLTAVDALYLSTSGVEVADDVPEKLLRRRHFNEHVGFEEHGSCF